MVAPLLFLLAAAQANNCDASRIRPLQALHGPAPHALHGPLLHAPVTLRKDAVRGGQHIHMQNDSDLFEWLDEDESEVWPWALQKAPADDSWVFDLPDDAPNGVNSYSLDTRKKVPDTRKNYEVLDTGNSEFLLDGDGSGDLGAKVEAAKCKLTEFRKFPSDMQDTIAGWHDTAADTYITYLEQELELAKEAKRAAKPLKEQLKDAKADQGRTAKQAEDARARFEAHVEEMAALAKQVELEKAELAELDAKKIAAMATMAALAAQWGEPVPTDLHSIPYYLRLFRHNLDNQAVSVWEAQNWVRREEQEKRFAVFVDKFNFQGKTVLDVGCGQGDFAQYLQRMGVTPTRLVGIDALPEFVQAARETAPRWAEYVVGDFVADPSVLGTEWDFIILSGSLSTIEPFDQVRVLANCWRATRRGMAFTFLPASETEKEFLDPVVWEMEFEGGKHPSLRAHAASPCGDAFHPGEEHCCDALWKMWTEEILDWGNRQAEVKSVKLIDDYSTNTGSDATIVMTQWHPLEVKQSPFQYKYGSLWSFPQ